MREINPKTSYYFPRVIYFQSLLNVSC